MTDVVERNRSFDSSIRPKTESLYEDMTKLVYSKKRKDDLDNSNQNPKFNNEYITSDDIKKPHNIEWVLNDNKIKNTEVFGLTFDQRTMLLPKIKEFLELLQKNNNGNHFPKNKTNGISKEHHNTQVKMVSVDGGIGATKTTIINKVSKKLNRGGNQRVIVSQESIDPLWLKTFNESPSVMAFPFQINQASCCAQDTTTLHALCQSKDMVGICDRSILGNCAFALTHYVYGNITESQIRLYNATMCRNGPIPYNLMIYLDCDINELSHRIYKRSENDPSRLCERNMSQRYLSDLDHVNLMLFIYMWMMTDVPILFLNNNNHNAFIPIRNRLLYIMSTPSPTFENFMEMGTDRKAMDNKLCLESISRFLVEYDYQQLKVFMQDICT